jgi:hypothetical protein
MRDLAPLLVFAVLGLVVRLAIGAVGGPRKQQGVGMIGVVIFAVLAAAVTWLLSVYLFK